MSNFLKLPPIYHFKKTTRESLYQSLCIAIYLHLCCLLLNTCKIQHTIGLLIYIEFDHCIYLNNYLIVQLQVHTLCFSCKLPNSSFEKIKQNFIVILGDNIWQKIIYCGSQYSISFYSEQLVNVVIAVFNDSNRLSLGLHHKKSLLIDKIKLNQMVFKLGVGLAYHCWWTDAFFLLGKKVNCEEFMNYGYLIVMFYLLKDLNYSLLIIAVVYYYFGQSHIVY